MIKISKPEDILRAYSNWLRLDNAPFWALATQPQSFVQTHVASEKGLNHFVKDRMDHFEVPVSMSYPLTKLNAGVVLTPNTWEVLARGFNPNLQQFLLDYLMPHLKEFQNSHIRIDKGFKQNSNDLYINGKKFFGELSFTKAGVIYYACMINFDLTGEDKQDILTGLKEDKNFYPDKVESLTGIENFLDKIWRSHLLEEIEAHLFRLAKTPEYINY